MLRFLENHDETRIASADFAGNAWYAVPGMVVIATLSSGPVMIYNGQEVGEPAAGASGFSGNDGRSTIFDYWGIPQHQKWMNNGTYDGGNLDDSSKRLREFYRKLLNVCTNNEAITSGKFYELLSENENSIGFNNKVYAFLRYTENRKVLVLANFNRDENKLEVRLPNEILAKFKMIDQKIIFTDLLSETKFETTHFSSNGLLINLPPTSAVILAF